MKRTKLRPVSKKRALQLRAYAIMRPIFLHRAPFCEVIDCMNPSTEIHHTKSRIGEMLLDERYLMAVCRPCHSKIHENPKWARENNYLK